MAREIINLTLSNRSIQALDRIRSQTELAKLGSYFISVGYVYNLVLSNSGHASRVINIGLSDWEAYQRTSDYPALTKGWLTTVKAIIEREACRMVLEFNEGQEKEFWKGLAGEGCGI